MKKVLSMALIVLMAAGTISAVAGSKCGSKCGGDKDKQEKATAEKTTADTQQTEASTSA